MHPVLGDMLGTSLKFITLKGCASNVAFRELVEFVRRRGAVVPGGLGPRMVVTSRLISVIHSSFCFYSGPLLVEEEYFLT